MMNINNIFATVKKIGFLHIFTSNLLVEVLAFGSQFFVAWILTPEDLGYIKVFQSFMAVYVVFSLFGFDTSLLILGASEPSKRLRYLRSAVTFLIIPSLVSIVLSVILGVKGVYSSDYGLNRLFIYFSIIIIPQVWGRLLFIDCQSNKEFSKISKIQFFSKCIAVLLIFILTYLFGLNGYVFACLIGAVITVILFVIYGQINFTSLLEFTKFNYLVVQKHFLIAKFALVSGLINVLQKYLDVFFLNFSTNDKKILGYYSFALTLLIPYIILLDSVSQVAIPYYCSLTGEPNKLFFNLKRYIIYYSCCGLLIVLLSFWIIPFLINICFGDKFMPSIKYFNILLFYWYFYGYLSIISSALISMKENKYIMYNGLVMLFVSFVTMFLFYKYYGIAGLIGSKIVIVIFSIISLFLFIKIRYIKNYEHPSLF